MATQASKNMNKIISIAHNATTAKIIDKDVSKELKGEMLNLLSYQVDGAEHSLAYRSKKWDGRSSFFNYSKNTFPRGFVAYVAFALKKRGYQVHVFKQAFPDPLGAEFPIVDDFPEEERYAYQREVIEKLLAHGQIIAQLATGGGKSRTAKLCAARINRPTLFLTTRGVLMYQMAESFKSLNRKVAIFGDNSLKISREITCAMVQTIASWLRETTPEDELKKMLESKDSMAKSRHSLIAEAKEKAFNQNSRRQKMIEALSLFEFVILEEAHESGGNQYFEILKHCKNAHYRLALTATPFMRDSEEANMRLMASSGHIAIKVSEKELIDRKILAKPYFKYINIDKKPDKLHKTTSWQRAYELGIVENDYRNRQIIQEAKNAVRYGLSVMILVQRKVHGAALKEKLIKENIKTEFIYGEDKQQERKFALDALAKKKIDVLIGSTILDVGVDVPAVGMIILAGGGKAEVALRQRIGRGLREKKDGSPNVAFIVDFIDSENRYLKEHSLQRKSIVMETKGFAENVVKDFDFEGLGFIKKK